jgi:imidazolonepropionase-like amidohydrolase
MRFIFGQYAVLLLVLGLVMPIVGEAKDTQPSVVLFENVRIFDGTSSALSVPSNVLVRGNIIERITTSPIPVDRRADTRIIQGDGRTLMPGLIDVHVHMTFGALSMTELLSPDLTPATIMAAASRNAEETLLRGFTAVRDAGGPIFELKAAIDTNRAIGPRIWPSGATISQTSGHGDMRLPHERSRRFFGEVSRAEQIGATFIADGRDEVLTATRENLRFGASQIKLMAGGGTSSEYDPIDVTQYTADEMRAGVEAAEDWGTYVTVHAYTPRAVQRAIGAGVRVIDHGQLLDEKTLRMMVEHDVWLSTQVLRPNTPNMDPRRVAKRQSILEGQARLWPTARKLGVKLAWGTDFLFEPALNHEQNSFITRLAEWFTPAEILKLVTHDNAQLLALSGLRSPYPGVLGVIKEGALADLLLVNGDPLTDINLIADPAQNFVVIMKDGKLFKDIVP